MENYTAIIGLLSTVVGAGIGYCLKYYLDKKKDLVSEITKERREMYQQFVDLIINILKATRSKKNSDTQQINELHDFFKKNILYASPKVVLSLSKFFGYLYSTKKDTDPRIILKHLTNIIREMRNDLGLSNKGLGQDGEELIKPLIRDWELLK